VAAVTAAWSAAQAADLPVREPSYKTPVYMPVFSWTGFYIGGDGGYGFGRSIGTADGSAGSTPLPYTIKADGGFGGGFIGANYQFAPNWVIGIEADWQAASLKGSTLLPDPGFRDTYTFETRVSDFGSARGRLGYAFDRFLVFGTGGVAWGSFKTSYGFTGLTPFYTNSVRAKTGWAAGAGLEYAATNNILLRVEYRHTDLGTISYFSPPFPAGTNSLEHGNHLTINDVRAGVAYKF